MRHRHPGKYRTRKGVVKRRPLHSHKKTYTKWKRLVNMSANEVDRFRKSPEGRNAGLSRKEANRLGIKSGQESASWIIRMKPKGKTYAQAEQNWTPAMWGWAGRQVRFNSRMRGNRGPLYKNGEKTRKHTSLLIWGHNPRK